MNSFYFNSILTKAGDTAVLITLTSVPLIHFQPIAMMPVVSSWPPVPRSRGTAQRHWTWTLSRVPLAGGEC